MKMEFFIISRSPTVTVQTKQPYAELFQNPHSSRGEGSDTNQDQLKSKKVLFVSLTSSYGRSNSKEDMTVNEE